MSFTVIKGILAAKIAYDAITNFLAFWNSDEWIISQFQAYQATPEQEPELYELVEKLAQKAEVPTPKIFIYNDQFPNACATGRDAEHAAIVVSSALKNTEDFHDTKLDREELEGILSHEMAHIKNKDVMINTAAAFIAGAMTSLVPIGVLSSKKVDSKDASSKSIIGTGSVLAAALVAEIMQMAVSKQREFIADETGGKLTGKPDVLADALQKLDKVGKGMVTKGATEANSHLFIVNPFGKQVNDLFSTHPSIEERVARLRKQALDMGRSI